MKWSGLSLRNLMVVALALMALAPADVFACATCYGKVDDRMADGMNWAILTLGVIVLTVLGAFLTFLIYLIRKSEAVEAARSQAAAQPNA
jgi:heme/copper-type cytochrome/quinol oxidase subunit 2